MDWRTALDALPPGGSGYDSAIYTDPDTGRVYTRRYSVQGATDASDAVYTMTGYVGADGGAWYPGKRAQLYDTAGRQIGDFEIKDPNRRDWGGMVALMFIAAVTAGAAYTAFTGAGAGGATASAPAANSGYGIVGGATEPVASISYAGAGTTAAATTAAGTLTSAGGVVSTVAGAATKVLGAAASVLGLQNAAAGPSAPRTVAPPPAAPAGGGLLADLSNIDTGTALFLAGALGLVAFVATRKG